MKLRKTWMSVLSCVLAFAMAFSFAACKPEQKDPVATALALDKTEASIATGESVKLNATATFDDGTNKELSSGEEGLTWTTSDEKIATVNRGVVSGKAKGSATITAKYGDFTATCSVSVYSLEVQLSEATATIEKGETKTLTAKAIKDGAEMTGAEFEWSSSDASVASVEGGVVTALMEGTAKITAKLKGYSLNATCDVTVTWTTRPAGYAEITNGEQNKGLPNTWHYWNDHNWNWTESTVYEAYKSDYEAGKTPAAGYEYIGAEKATISFEVEQPGADQAAIQLFYRSSKVTEGKLEQNHNYEVTLKLETNVSGKVYLNDYTKAPEGEEKEDVGIEVEAGKVNTLTVQFRHGDSGKKYRENVYDNVESAIHLLLGDLAGRVTVSVYDLQYKDLGESEEKFEDDPSKLDGYVAEAELPDLSETPAIALDIASEDAKYTITKLEEGKSYNVKYAGTVSNSYENIEVVIPESANAAACNTFEVTITNNAETAMTIRFDINGETATGANNVIDIVKSALASKGNAETNLEWGGTALTVAGGDTVTLQLTYDANTERGKPTKLLVYFDTVWAAQNDEHSGDVTIGGFKFANVVDTKKSATANEAQLKQEGEKMYLVVTGTCKNYTLDELKAAVGIYLQSGDMNPTNDVHPADGEVTVTLNENGTYEVKWDITGLNTGYYLMHLAPEFLGSQYGDIFHESATEPVTVGGKSFSFKQYSFDNNAWQRYCLTVE